MTTRCAVFAEEEQSVDQDHDITQEAFWLKLAENFKRSRRMLEVMAAEMGIEFDPAETARIGKEQEAKRSQIRREPLVILAEKYLKEAGTLLSSDKYSENDSDEIDEDMLSIVHWYVFFISAKIQRGFHSFEETEMENSQSDFNGSIKIALIAIDRSIAAWTNLTDRENFDRIRPVVSLLETLRTDCEKTFPGARGFLRPGFDEIDIVM
jgi:hypothetical protein